MKYYYNNCISPRCALKIKVDKHESLGFCLLGVQLIVLKAIEIPETFVASIEAFILKVFCCY